MEREDFEKGITGLILKVFVGFIVGSVLGLILLLIIAAIFS